MPTTLAHLDIRMRPAWRRWLAAHHDSSPGVWLRRHKRHTGVATMSYEDVVCEALCFGWIDSLVKRVDEDVFLMKVTPRRAGSRWSDLNRRRWQQLHAAGLLAPPGLAAAPTARGAAPKPRVPDLPADIAAAFKRVPAAWTFFQSLPAGERRNFVVWIHTAKRAETRDRRLRESLDRLAAGRRLGLK